MKIADPVLLSLFMRDNEKRNHKRAFKDLLIERPPLLLRPLVSVFNANGAH